MLDACPCAGVPYSTCVRLARLKTDFFLFGFSCAVVSDVMMQARSEARTLPWRNTRAEPYVLRRVQVK